MYSAHVRRVDIRKSKCLWQSVDKEDGLQTYVATLGRVDLCYLFVQTVTVAVCAGGERLLFRIKLLPWYQTCHFLL